MLKFEITIRIDEVQDHRSELSNLAFLRTEITTEDYMTVVLDWETICSKLATEAFKMVLSDYQEE